MVCWHTSKVIVSMHRAWLLVLVACCEITLKTKITLLKEGKTKLLQQNFVYFSWASFQFLFCTPNLKTLLRAFGSLYQVAPDQWIAQRIAQRSIWKLFLVKWKVAAKKGSSFWMLLWAILMPMVPNRGVGHWLTVTWKRLLEAPGKSFRPVVLLCWHPPSKNGSNLEPNDPKADPVCSSHFGKPCPTWILQTRVSISQHITGKVQCLETSGCSYCCMSIFMSVFLRGAYWKKCKSAHNFCSNGCRWFTLHM